MQQRVSHKLDMSKEQEKVDALVTEDIKAEYEAIEAISNTFDRKKLGYRHSPYLVLIAAVVAS